MLISQLEEHDQFTAGVVSELHDREEECRQLRFVVKAQAMRQTSNIESHKVGECGAIRNQLLLDIRASLVRERRVCLALRVKNLIAYGDRLSRDRTQALRSARAHLDVRRRSSLSRPAP